MRNCKIQVCILVLHTLQLWHTKHANSQNSKSATHAKDQGSIMLESYSIQQKKFQELLHCTRLLSDSLAGPTSVSIPPSAGRQETPPIHHPPTTKVASNDRRQTWTAERSSPNDPPDGRRQTWTNSNQRPVDDQWSQWWWGSHDWGRQCVLCSWYQYDTMVIMAGHPPDTRLLLIWYPFYNETIPVWYRCDTEALVLKSGQGTVSRMPVSLRPSFGKTEEQSDGGCQKSRTAAAEPTTVEREMLMRSARVRCRSARMCGAMWGMERRRDHDDGAGMDRE